MTPTLLTAPTPHTVFWDVADPRQALADLRGPGAFVPARLPVAAGERVVLSCRVAGASRRVELIATVAGRRLPRGAGRQLGAGLMLKLAPADEPSAHLLEDVAMGRVVELRQATPARWPMLTWSFDDPDALRHALDRVLQGGRALVPSAEVERGDRVRVAACAPGQRVTFNATARGLAMVNDEKLVSIALAGDRDLEVLQAQLAGRDDVDKQWHVG